MYRFDWDADKAPTNLQNHGVSFPQASSGPTLVVMHTFVQLDHASAEIRLISARKADRYEREDYEQMPR